VGGVLRETMVSWQPEFLLAVQWSTVRRGKESPAKVERSKKRFRALSQSISAEDVAYHRQFLQVVPVGKGFCWIYARKSTGGASRAYGRFKFHGEWVLAHRFALALKLGCSLWKLEGYDAAHAPADVCMGGRCCNPAHLEPKLSDPNRSWDRAKDAEKFGVKPHRTKEQQREMIRSFYPLKVSPSLPDFITLI